MSHITFKKLFAKNFRSIDNMGLSVDYNSGKTTLVASTDNGSGKSTIWRDALYYVLFDKPYAKGQSKSQLINSRSGNNSLVRLEFEKGGIEYIVERGQKPSVFNIIVDGEPLNKEAVNFQQVLADILGGDEKLFTNSVILGADKFVPFTRMGAEERRKFGDQMLDLMVITNMSSINKERLKTINKDITDTNHQLSVLEVQQKGVEQVIQVKKANSEDVQRGLESDIIGISKELDETSEQLSVKEAEKLQYEADAKTAQDEKSSIEERLSAEYAPKIKQARESVSVAESVTNQALESELKEHQEKMFALSDKIKAEELTIADQERLFKEQFETRSKYEQLVVDLKAKLESLVEPNKDEPCSHCGGVVGEEFYQKHLDEYLTKKSKLEAGIVQAEAQVAKGSNLDQQYAAWDERGRNELDALKTESQKYVELAQEVKIKIASFESEKRNGVMQAQAELTAIKNELQTQMSERLSDIKTKINSISVHIGVLTDDISRLNYSLVSQRNKLKDKQKQLDEAKANSSYADEQVQFNTLTNSISEMKTNLDELYKKQSINNLLLNSLKDDGIKAKLVENYLPYINDRINFYLEKLNFFVRVELSREYELDMFAPERKGQTIDCLSAGQQKRIDLAVLLAWRDLARQAATNSCNVLILDEVCEALSESGVIDFMEMWRSIDESKYTNLVVITQRQAEFEPLFDECKLYKLVDLATVEVSE